LVTLFVVTWGQFLIPSLGANFDPPRGSYLLGVWWMHLWMPIKNIESKHTHSITTGWRPSVLP
jgi:hypothetical protein